MPNARRHPEGVSPRDPAIRAVLALFFAASVAAASGPVIEVGPAPWTGAVPKRSPRPEELWNAAGRLPDSARHALGPLTRLERLRIDGGGPAGASPRPLRIGLTRRLAEPVGFDALPDLAPGQAREVGGGLLEGTPDGVVWSVSFSSDGARGVRLLLGRTKLPFGSRAYVYGGGEAHGPYAFAGGTRPEGFWTNAVFAPSLTLEVRVPRPQGGGTRPAARLHVDGVAHLETSVGLALPDDSCLIDSRCVAPEDFPQAESAARAVAELIFAIGTDHFVCSGGLLNTTAGASVPYLLTANHCISTPETAASLEAVWQWRSPSCGAPAPTDAGFPRTLGSTLLATGAAPDQGDFTLLQLSESPPEDSVALGWTTADLFQANSLVIYRMSHPNGLPLVFTREQIRFAPLCPSFYPQSRFVYGTEIEGGTHFGSSGAPSYLGDLRVVGIETAKCGPHATEACAGSDTATVDGAFSGFFDALSPWLAPAGAPCAPTPTTLCLDGARFRVSASYLTSEGRSGVGTAQTLSGDSGYFWFFSADNIELIVKALTGCGTNGRFWVFAGGLTNVGVTLIVEDTATGASRIYSSTAGTAFAPLQDTQAFSCP